MSRPQLTEREIEIVSECLRAAADGSFFPDWEFETLIGASRNEIRIEGEAWLSSKEGSKKTTELILSVISNLLGYPHDKRLEIKALIGAGRSELNALLSKLSA